jgi:hypothetical protein
MIGYTGSLLLGHDFIRELYVHMGFHPAWKYREIHELVFDKGRLVNAADRSTEMAMLRDSLSGTKDAPGSIMNEDVAAWVERCFSLKYNW